VKGKAEKALGNVKDAARDAKTEFEREHPKREHDERETEHPIGSRA
jgi:uncharacterized protein YjbJ (UPF0337 family)